MHKSGTVESGHVPDHVTGVILQYQAAATSTLVLCLAKEGG